MLPSMSPRRSRRPEIAIVGAGNLGSALTISLANTQYRVGEVISRDSKSSRRKASALARRIGARAISLNGDEIRSQIVWLCIPDREIEACANALAHLDWNGRIALHSSGALGSDALRTLRSRGARAASVHPLMTFVPAVTPSLKGVGFAIEGDEAAVRTGRKIIAALGAHSYRIARKDKVLYHAWATFASPLLTILLEVGERVAQAAHVSQEQARRRSAPILRQTIDNYVRQGAARGFSGPIVRGDVATIRRHLQAIRRVPGAREVYVTLAKAAVKTLPVHDRAKVKRLLR
jgi:predicted short-subunit dehydrogenase-like oxidoreductase (DUF2520 family)